MRPTAAVSQLAVEDVWHSYPDGTMALRGVSLVLQAGEFVALLGPNGSGKTTLAKHLNGLLKPTRGRVRVEQFDTRTARVSTIARMIGYVFQNPDHQIFAPTVQEEIAFGPRIQGLPPAEVARRVADAMARFRLTPYADLPPALLGYGQRRQVALAAIIAGQPQALILDEPTVSLDWRSQQELMEVVTGYNAQGHIVLLITHDMRLVAEYATRAAVLLEGQVLFDGTPRQLFAQPDILAEARLAAPPIARLASRLATVGLSPGILTCTDFVAAWPACLASVQRPPLGGLGRQPDAAPWGREASDAR